MECMISNSSNMHQQKMHIVLLPVFLSPLSKKWLISFASLELPSLCDSTAAGSGSVLGPGISPGKTRSQLSTSWQLGSLSSDSWNQHLEDQIPPQKTGLDHQLVPSLAPHLMPFLGATVGHMGGDACLHLVACAVFFLVGCGNMVEMWNFMAEV